MNRVSVLKGEPSRAATRESSHSSHREPSRSATRESSHSVNREHSRATTLVEPSRSGSRPSVSRSGSSAEWSQGAGSPSRDTRAQPTRTRTYNALPMIDEDRSLQRSSHFDSERSRYDPGRPLSDASRMPIEEPSRRRESRSDSKALVSYSSRDARDYESRSYHTRDGREDRALTRSGSTHRDDSRALTATRDQDRTVTRSQSIRDRPSERERQLEKRVQKMEDEKNRAMERKLEKLEDKIERLELKKSSTCKSYHVIHDHRHSDRNAYIDGYMDGAMNRR